MSGLRLSDVFAAAASPAVRPPVPAVVKIEAPDNLPPIKFPIGHPRGYNGADDVTYAPDTTMDVMRPAEVRKRSEADRGKKDIQLIGAVNVKKRKAPETKH